MAWLYLSSTYQDLVEARRRVATVLRAIDHKVIGMEEYSASDDRPLNKCLADIGQCDAYVGIIGNRYGYTPVGHDGKSITQLEYEEATRLKLKRFIFIVDSESSSDPRLQEFRQHLSDVHMVARWKDISQLGEAVVTAVAADKQLAAGSRLPALLPYLCDRGPQMTAFRDAFYQSLGDDGAGQPLVVLVHGDEREAHSRFLERMKVHVIPKLYQPVGRRTAALAPVRLDWPTDLVERAQIHRRLEGLLAEKLDAPPTRQAVQKRLTTIAGLVFAEMQVLTQECRRAGPESVEHFVDFWDGLFGEVAPVPLVVALSVKYSRPGLLPFGLKGFNAKLQARLKLLSGAPRSAIRVAVLPELKAVGQSDVLAWADIEEIRRCCFERNLEPDIRQLFDQYGGSDGMPMEDLAERLNEMLQRHSRQEKDHDRAV